MPKRVLIAGSSRLHAEALGAVIGNERGVELVGVALSPADAGRLLTEQGADVLVAEPAVRPDLGGNGQSSPEVVLVSPERPLSSVLDEVRGDDPDDPEARPLTAREQSVLELLGQALPPKQVAQRLGISVHTCRGYVKTVLAKLDSHSILEAVLEGQRRGLLPPEAPRSLP
jgi:DNA-binding NarL/FixJ family response regulator